MMKKTIYICAIILLISACETKNRVNENLIGDWNIFYLIHKEENLLNNYNNDTFMTGFFKITENGFFIIDNLEGYKINGIIQYKNGGNLQILNSSEPGLDDSYNIELESVQTNKTIMTLRSQNTEIYAEKRNVDFSKF